MKNVRYTEYRFCPNHFKKGPQPQRALIGLSRITRIYATAYDHTTYNLFLQYYY